MYILIYYGTTDFVFFTFKIESGGRPVFLAFCLGFCFWRGWANHPQFDTRYLILDTRFIFLVGLGLAAWLVFSSEEASVTPGVGQVFIFSLVLSLSPLLSRSRWYLHAPRRILRIYFNRAPYSSPPSHTAPMSLPESSEHPIGLERPKAVSLPYPTAVASGLRSFPKARLRILP